MSILKKLREPWPVDFALQPQNAAERFNVIQIQTLKRMAAEQIASLRDWIKSEGERTDTCTYYILHEVCKGCKCGKKK